jgi:SAM-dependent methyltransferase
MSGTYAAVDDSGDPEGAADWQEQMATWPAVHDYKQHVRTLVDGLAPLLDVGRGPGLDLAAFGRGAVGIDPSRTMCGRARGRAAAVGQARGDALPFIDGSFGACRADRVLQHVEVPQSVLAEMARVTRCGGKVAIAEPDQESLVLAVPGVVDSRCDEMKALRRDVGYRHGRLARHLPEMLRRLGFEDITVDAFPLVLTDPDDAFGLPGWPRYWRTKGLLGWSDDDLSEWDLAIDRSRREGVVYVLNFLVLAGVRA